MFRVKLNSIDLVLPVTVNNISKHGGVFLPNKINSHRNKQYSLHLLSKCLENLFPGLLERPDF